MAAVYKVVGQSAPSATTATTLYTVPASTQTVISTISICNMSSTSTTFRLAVRPAGAALASQHYLVYDATISGNNSTVMTMGMSLATTDVITVYAGAATLAFTAFGVENP